MNRSQYLLLLNAKLFSASSIALSPEAIGGKSLLSNLSRMSQFGGFYSVATNTAESPR